MEHHLVDSHDQGQNWWALCNRHGGQQIRVGNDLACAANPEDFAPSWDDKHQTDSRSLQHVVQGVESAIAGTVGNGQRFVVENSNETRRVTLG